MPVPGTADHHKYLPADQAFVGCCLSIEVMDKILVLLWQNKLANFSEIVCMREYWFHTNLLSRRLLSCSAMDIVMKLGVDWGHMAVAQY